MTEVLKCDGCGKLITADYWEMDLKVEYQDKDASRYGYEAVEYTAHACSRACLKVVGADAARNIATAKVEKEPKQ